MCLEYLHLIPDSSLPDISHLAPFKAMLILEAPCPEEWQNKVCRWIIEMGGLNVDTWGIECNDWSDALLRAMHEVFIDEVPDEHFIMTSWHDDESLKSAFFYLGACAYLSYTDVELENTLLLHIGGENKEQEILEEYHNRGHDDVCENT